MGGPKIRSVGLAVPPYAVRQSDIKKFAAALFQERMGNLERLLLIFDNAGIVVRYLAQPLEWYAVPHTFAESNHTGAGHISTSETNPFVGSVPLFHEYGSKYS